MDTGCTARFPLDSQARERAVPGELLVFRVPHRLEKGDPGDSYHGLLTRISRATATALTWNPTTPQGRRTRATTKQK